MRRFDAFRLTKNIKDGVEGIEVVAEAVVVHVEEEFNGAVRFSVSGVTLGEDS